MKKTIAILLVLVIGMVGVFAVDAVPATQSSNATIDLTTAVDGYGAFGLTASTAQDLTVAAVASYEAFTTAVSANVDFGTTAMSAFEDSPIVGYLHGISNYSSAINLSITVTPFTTSDEGLTTASIPLTVSPATKSIPAAAAVRGYFLNQPLTVTATKADVDLAPASDNYTATVTITVSTT